jgi:hypothetical protein
MEVVGFLKSTHGMGHGHANALIGLDPHRQRGQILKLIRIT